MARWSELEAQEPAFAAAVLARLDAGIHKTIATLRADGAPRISGIETILAEGDLWVGSMPGARKGDDLRRDPRFALHSPSLDPPADHAAWEGDAKLAGRAAEVTDPDQRLRIFRSRGSEPPSLDSLLFRLEITEAVRVALNAAADAMVVESWHEGRGMQRVQR